MGKRTEEMLEKAIDLHSKGWTKRDIARECGVSPQYVSKLIKMHEQNRHKSPERNYGLSTRVLNCLKRYRIPVDAHVIADSIDLLLPMRGLGKGSLAEIGMMLKGLNIIHNVEEWIEEGKQKQYNQRQTSFREDSYDLPRRQHVPQIGL